MQRVKSESSKSIWGQNQIDSTKVKWISTCMSEYTHDIKTIITLQYNDRGFVIELFGKESRKVVRLLNRKTEL